MKRIKFILKGILLYVTAFAVALLVSGIDNIIDSGHFLYWVIPCIVLCYACYKLISPKELEEITLYKQFSKMLGE